MKRHLDKATPVWAIHAVNTAWIALLMIAVPSITGIELGSLRISSNHWLQRLLLAGLSSGFAFNAAMSWRCRPTRQRTAYRGWSLLYVAILAVALLTYSGTIHFDWLRDLLEEVGRARLLSAARDLRLWHANPAFPLPLLATAGLVLIRYKRGLASAIPKGITAEELK